ncbi:MAG: bifunctional DNA primase/polymerase [Planctomycetes bacterium]|nr:bifunctional DNA primase/polymerase [Planctomycetota bacterium]
MSNPVLDAARRYLGLGFSVIPIRPGTKKPAVETWGGYQRRLPNASELDRWFTDGKNGVGIICGVISGDLVVRDFDSMSAYEAWAATHPDLAKTLPTVATARGRHVYARLPGAKTRVKLGDGELRAEGVYVVAPPSLHPDGPRYEWVVPLDGALHTVSLADLAAEGGATEKRTTPGPGPECTEKQSNRDLLRGTERDGFCLSESQSLCCAWGLNGLSPDDAAAVRRAIDETVPMREGERNDQVFEFVRALKAIRGLRGRAIGDLRPIVQEWHSRALPFIGSKDFETTWEDFGNASAKARLAKGENPLDTILSEIEGIPVPPAVAKFQTPRLSLLARICVGLQRKMGESPFILGCRDAARLLGMEDYVRASRFLRRLVELGFLKEVEHGGFHGAPDKPEKRASRYRVADDGGTA